MRDMSNKSAKARMGASVRRGVDPKKGGQWITGTWDGGTWSAMVFSEPSEAYGIPEFPHISKLAINPKDRPGIGGVIVNYDRGWDIKPSTPELQKAYREIAQAATAEVKKAVKQGWYARTGSKAKMAMTPIRVTEAEYAALAARDAVSRKILGDSQYQITPSDRAIRASGDVAYKTALARHNAWDKAWRDAPNDAARAEVEARAKAAEAGMRVYRGSRPGAKATMGRMLHSHEVDELEEFLDAYGVKDYDIIKSIGQVKVPKSQVGKALDAIASLNREIRKEGIGGSVAVDVVPFSRPGAKARFASNDRARIQQELRRLLSTARAQGGANGREAARLASMYLSEISNPKVSDEDLDDANSATYMIAEVLKGNYSRPCAKAKMALDMSVLSGAKSLEVFIKDLMGAINVGNAREAIAVCEDISKKANDVKQRIRDTSKFSRPGAKVTAGRAEDLYRQLSSGSITYANAKQWERLVTEALRLPDYTPPGGDMSLHEIAEDLGGDLMALKTHSGPVPHAKAKAEKPSDLEREDVKAGLKLMEKADKAVSDKIRTLIAEGKPQDQAVAIALDMKRRGEL